MTDSASAEARIAALEATVATLHERIVKLEDDRGIRDVLAEYGYWADTCQDEAFVDLYTEDGTMKVVANAKARKVYDTGEWILYENKQGIRDFITHPGGHHSPALYGKSMHLQGNNLVTHVEGDEAYARGYQVAIAVTDDGMKVLSAGNNRWQLRKVDGKWLIRERRGAYLGDDHFNRNIGTPENPTE